MQTGTTALKGEDAARSTGAAVFPEVSTKATAQAELDDAIEALQAKKDDWAELSASEKATILDELLGSLLASGLRWVAASAEAKGIDLRSPRAGEEWGALMVVIRLTRLLRDSVRAIARGERPRIPGGVQARPDGQVVAHVFPASIYDRMFFPNQTAEVWLQPSLRLDDFEAAHRAASLRTPTEGKLTLVLGAGNFANVPVSDVIHALFVQDSVVLLKTNPVNEYLVAIYEEALEPLLRRGYLRIVAGGAEVGAYLVKHEGVDRLHMTGSDKTHDAIVFGSGDEGRARKAKNQPINTKPFTCELGNISPVIVVPGPWSERDLAYQGEHIASMLTFNAGFMCLAARLIVQHRTWEHRDALLGAIRKSLAATPTRKAFYPGARQIHADFIARHPDADQLGDPGKGHLPWTVVADVDSNNAADMCFTNEAFCSLFAEMNLQADNVADFIDAAVDFVNDKVWGSLSATIIVHPKSMADPIVAAAVERAVSDLRYGTVSVNLWGLMSFLFGVTTWGAYPGHTVDNIQSGRGVVNNALMLPQVQKSVARGPFRQWPKPSIFASHKTTGELMERFGRFESAPSLLGTLGVTWAAIRG